VVIDRQGELVGEVKDFHPTVPFSSNLK